MKAEKKFKHLSDPSMGNSLFTAISIEAENRGGGGMGTMSLGGIL